MSALDFEVDFSGWSVPLGAARVATADPRDALEEVGQIVEAAVKRNIADEGGVEHWPPLAVSTLRDRARKGFAPGPMLQRTRELIRTITHVVNAASAYVDIGSPLKKSWALFLGSRAIPRRSPFGFTRADEFSIMGAFVRHFFGGITRGLYS